MSYYDYRNNNDFEITKREVLFSIIIISIMMLIGVVIHGNIADEVMLEQQKYNTALQIENDSDLCESYVYNDETKEIKLNCFETTEQTITSIKIVEVSEDRLELDFNEEIRKFAKEK